MASHHDVGDWGAESNGYCVEGHGGLAHQVDVMVPVDGDETHATDRSCEHAVSLSDLRPAGRGHGIPVARSSVAMELPGGMELFFLAMQFVRRDDYFSIMQLARAGCAYDVLHPSNVCGFSLCLRPEDGLRRQHFPRILHVRCASLLHYAICIQSKRAAAALLIVKPHLLVAECIVSAENVEEAAVWKPNWTASDLAVLFCDLYAIGRTDETKMAETDFKNMLSVLRACASDPEKMPFVSLPSVEERVAAAAGMDSDAACCALLDSAAYVAEDARDDLGQ